MEMHSSRKGPKVLVVLHQENSTPGRVGQELVRRGFQLDIRKPRFGDALPQTMSEHAAAVIFGGPQSANDTDSYIHREIDWISVPLREEKPFLGICLGAQMMAKNIGGSVAPHKEGQVEIGYYPLEATQQGQSLMKWPTKVYQWHNEGFHLPKTADVEMLARGTDIFPNQAYRVGQNAFGIQFHPELTQAMMHRWTTKGSARMTQPGAQHRRDHFSGRFIFDPPVLNWMRDFMDLWIGTAEKPASLQVPRSQAAE